MPYVSIQITREPAATAKRREQLISLVTDAVVFTLDKDPRSTFVVIEEIGTDSWGVAGESVATRRARGTPPASKPNEAGAVVAVIDRYFDGLHRGDVALLREVFHPHARLLGFAPADPARDALPETASSRSLDEYLKAVAERTSPRDRGESMRSRVLSVQCDGPLAFVRALVPMLGFSYLDHLMLTREAGTWRISQKQFAHGVSAYDAGTAPDAKG